MSVQPESSFLTRSLLAASLLAGLLFSSPSQAILVAGTVRSSTDMTGIPQAVVRQQATSNAATTNATGEFSVDLPTGTPVMVTAAKLGFYNNGQFVTAEDPPSPIVIDLEPIPSEPPLPNPFNDPANSCSFCHSSFYSDWRGATSATPSRHSTAGKNTWVRDLYDGSGTGGGLAQSGYVFKRDATSVAAGSPYTTGLCAECHLPLLASLVPADATPAARTELSDATAGSPSDSLERIAYNYGVACEACHKMENVEQANGLLGRTGFFGKAAIKRTDRALQFGPLDDANFMAQPVMRTAFNNLHRSSLLCAACHEYNMDHNFDGDFDDPGSPPGQTTYSEWLNSTYAASGITCQDCHMAPDGVLTQIGFGGPVRSATEIHNHRFEGTTLPFLQAAVSLVLQASRTGGELDARVDVMNVGAGHNFPTGFSTRNVILAVTATTELGETLSWLDPGTDLVPDWGGVGPDANDYGLKPGRGFARVLYGRGAIEGTTKERVIFIDALGEKSNSTIPPGGIDRSRYRFDLSGLAGHTVTVEARLLYRRMWKDVVDIKGWTLDGQGKPYGDVLVRSARFPDSCDLIASGRCDAADLIAFLRDHGGIEDYPTNFDGANGEDALDLFFFASRWYRGP